MSCCLNTKFLFKIVSFLGVRGVTTSSYIVFGYTTSRYMNL